MLIKSRNFSPKEKKRRFQDSIAGFMAFREREYKKQDLAKSKSKKNANKK